VNREQKKIRRLNNCNQGEKWYSINPSLLTELTAHGFWLWLLNTLVKINMVVNTKCKMQSLRTMANPARKADNNCSLKTMLTLDDRIYKTTRKAILPLPDPDAPVGSPAHLNVYPEFPVGSIVMALYPDTSCFYRAEVIATPDRVGPPQDFSPLNIPLKPHF
jgi:hypothetical protein